MANNISICSCNKFEIFANYMSFDSNMLVELTRNKFSIYVQYIDPPHLQMPYRPLFPKCKYDQQTTKSLNSVFIISMYLPKHTHTKKIK